MSLRMLAGIACLALGLGGVGGAQAQYLQPGMRTMIQQGGIEPGPLLGVILPGYGYDPEFGFGFPRRPDVVYDEPAGAYARPVATLDGPALRHRAGRRRHAQSNASHRMVRHRFAR